MFQRGCPVVAVLLVGVPVLAQPLSDKETATVREETFTTINKLRQEEKVLALKRQKDLDKLAQDHAANLARQDKYGDDGVNGHVLDGKDFVDRLKASPYPYRTAGENVHGNQQESSKQAVQEAVQAWKNSPGHWSSIINGRFTETGLGVGRGKSGRWYFVQVFAAPR